MEELNREYTTNVVIEREGSHLQNHIGYIRSIIQNFDNRPLPGSHQTILTRIRRFF